MSDDRIIFRGVRVLPEWPARIATAQFDHTWSIDGETVSRVRFGEETEDWGADRGPCHDCVVVKGEFHVPGCDAERCPKCGGQAIGCDCLYDGDDES